MRRLNWERVVSILLIAPAVIAIAVFVYGFIGWTAYVSLTKWDQLLYAHWVQQLPKVV
jgi:glucose/mannose transport system permease protein